VILYSRKNCDGRLDEWRREAKLTRLMFTVLSGSLGKPGNICQGVGDRCKYSDDFLEAYDTWQIGLCLVVYP